VAVGGRRCVCGARGCLAMYASGFSLAEEAQRRVAGNGGSKLLTLAGGEPQAITAKTVFEAAAAGDPTGQALVADLCEHLAAALGGLVNILNPEVLVVTGGLAASLVGLEREVLGRARVYALAPALATTRIHIIAGDKRQTMRGGAALVRYELRRRRGATRPADRRDRDAEVPHRA
jgi:glucokinase